MRRLEPYEVMSIAHVEDEQLGAELAAAKVLAMFFVLPREMNGGSIRDSSYSSSRSPFSGRFFRFGVSLKKGGPRSQQRGLLAFFGGGGSRKRAARRSSLRLTRTWPPPSNFRALETLKSHPRTSPMRG